MINAIYIYLIINIIELNKYLIIITNLYLFKIIYIYYF